MRKKLSEWFDKIPARDLACFSLGFSAAVLLITILVDIVLATMPPQ